MLLSCVGASVTAMTPRVVASLFLGLGLVLYSAAGVASAATPTAVPKAQVVPVPAWFSGLHLDAGKPLIKNQCPNR